MFVALNGTYLQSFARLRDSLIVHLGYDIFLLPSFAFKCGESYLTLWTVPLKTLSRDPQFILIWNMIYFKAPPIRCCLLRQFNLWLSLLLWLRHYDLLLFLIPFKKWMLSIGIVPHWALHLVRGSSSDLLHCLSRLIFRSHHAWSWDALPRFGWNHIILALFKTPIIDISSFSGDTLSRSGIPRLPTWGSNHANIRTGRSWNILLQVPRRRRPFAILLLGNSSNLRLNDAWQLVLLLLELSQLLLLDSIILELLLDWCDKLPRLI